VDPCYQPCVIHLPTSPAFHTIGDLTAWLVAFLGGRWVYRRRRASVELLARQTAPDYFVSLALGAAAGAWLLGSLNTLQQARPTFSHSVAGGLAGAIIAVEMWKWVRGIKGSTGGPFVIPLALGIMVGRLGCLFAGLPDQTYGIPTSLPWGVDLGDGIARHPVQLYESLSMLAFLVVYWRALLSKQQWATRRGFHAYVLFYAVQRFAWEFFKPYPKILGPLNVFNLAMIGLILYALVWIARGDDSPAST